MKTRDLIKQLQETDPSGELEVTVGKTDIHFAETIPGYHDGCYQVLKRDPNIEGYNIVGAEIRSNDQHVCIHTLSICNALLDDPKLPVEFADDYAREHCEHEIETWRKEMQEINDQVDAWFENQ